MGRSLVQIYGDGFRLPTIPPIGNAPAEPGVAPVRVLFGGVPAERVDVLASNRLAVLPPPTPIALGTPDWGTGSVDVEVTNLDDAGAPIPGETVVVADAYTYARVDLATSSDLLRLVRRLMELFKSQVLPNTVLTTHTDYDNDVSTYYVDVSSLPGISLAGPTLEENRLYSLNGYLEHDPNTTDGTQLLRRAPFTVDLSFAVDLVTESTQELLNLMALVTQFVDRNPFVSMDRDPSDLAKGTVRYEFDWAPGGTLAVATGDNESNIRRATGTVIVRGFDVEDLAGLDQELAVMVTNITSDVDVVPTVGQTGTSYPVGPSPGGEDCDCA